MLKRKKKRIAKKVPKKANKLEKIMIWLPLFGVVAFILIYGYVDPVSAKAEVAAKELPVITAVDAFPKRPTKVPGPHNNNWRAPELKAQAFKQFIIDNNIEYVFRLNGDKSDSNGLSIAKMKAICVQVAKEYGRTIHFKYTNIEPYCDGNTAAIDEIVAAMKKGNVYVCCKHGFDRTGSVVARYMLEIGYTLNDILYHNNWINYIERKGEKYKRYYLCATQA